jgi:hypothetical protein
MSLKYLICSFLLFSNFILAETSDPEKEALEKGLELLKEIEIKNDNPAINYESCLACYLSFAKESTNPGYSNICEDLFGAACRDVEGKNKYQGRSIGLTLELSDVLTEAREKTIKEMGYKNLDEALKIKLKEAGLELVDNPDPELWNKLKGVGVQYPSLDGSTASLFIVNRQCNEELEKLKSEEGYFTADFNELTKIAKKFEDFVARNNESKIGYNALDIPDFLSSNLFPKCTTLETKSTYQPLPENNPEIVKACANKAAIKEKAIELYRLEGTLEYKEKAEQFVRENLLPSLNNDRVILSERPQAEILRSKIINIVNDYYFCENNEVERAAKKVYENLLLDLNKSKTTVESVLDAFYGEEKRKNATHLFNKAKENIQILVKNFVKDSGKRDEILREYDRLKLHWVDKPPEDFYKKNSKGYSSLDEDKARPLQIPGLDGDPYLLFNDPSLSHFTQLNANYQPTMVVGKLTNAERVMMMPAFNFLLGKNDFTYLATVAHEVGHKIGPEVSRINGHDLSGEYKDLVNCFKGIKSIKMLNVQADETIADYIGAEVMAMELAKLPMEKRRGALMSGMENFCIFEDSQEGLDLRENHPNNMFRASGIYGANSNLRKVIGCEGESSKFKSCDLKDISLPQSSANGENQ